MKKPLFFASKLKITRAEKHIREIEASFKSYIQSKPLTARFDTETNPPSIILNWTASAEEDGAIVGDAVHNLRAALDLMASELVRLKGASDKNVYFPFAENLEDFREAIRKRNFHKAGQDAVDLLLSFEPYRGGNRLLRALHDLDVADKHSAIIPIGSAMNIRFMGAYEIDNIANGSISVDGDIHFVFPDDSPLAGEAVIDTLKTFAGIVIDILEAFERLVELRKATTG